jgi:hypothetical protein
MLINVYSKNTLTSAVRTWKQTQSKISYNKQMKQARKEIMIGEFFSIDINLLFLGTFFLFSGTTLCLKFNFS